MNEKKCREAEFIDMGETVIEGIFDSKRVWTTLLGFSVIMIFLAAVSVWKSYTFLCVALCGIAFVLSIIGTAVGMRDRRVKFKVTSKCIYRRTLFGRHTYLPLDSIRAVDLMCMNSISVRTAVGNFNCHLLRNNREVFLVIKALLDERQAGR